MKRSSFKNVNATTCLKKRNVYTDGNKFLWPGIHHMQFGKGGMTM